MKKIFDLWQLGRVLSTHTTRNMTPEQLAKLQAQERDRVCSNFSANDAGVSRKLVCTINDAHPDYETNRALVILAPQMANTITTLAESLETTQPDMLEIKAKIDALNKTIQTLQYEGYQAAPQEPAPKPLEWTQDEWGDHAVFVSDNRAEFSIKKSEGTWILYYSDFWTVPNSDMVFVQIKHTGPALFAVPYLKKYAQNAYEAFLRWKKFEKKSNAAVLK
jgi:hypothetical protein